MDTITLVLRTHPIDDMTVEHPDGTTVDVTEDQARELGATDDDMYEARKGYSITFEACATENLDTLFHGYGD